MTENVEIETWKFLQELDSFGQPPPPQKLISASDSRTISKTIERKLDEINRGKQMLSNGSNDNGTFVSIYGNSNKEISKEDAENWKKQVISLSRPVNPWSEQQKTSPTPASPVRSVTVQNGSKTFQNCVVRASASQKSKDFDADRSLGNHQGFRGNYLTQIPVTSGFNRTEQPNDVRTLNAAKTRPKQFVYCNGDKSVSSTGGQTDIKSKQLTPESNPEEADGVYYAKPYCAAENDKSPVKTYYHGGFSLRKMIKNETPESELQQSTANVQRVKPENTSKKTIDNKNANGSQEAVPCWRMKKPEAYKMNTVQTKVSKMPPEKKIPILSGFGNAKQVSASTRSGNTGSNRCLISEDFRNDSKPGTLRSKLFERRPENGEINGGAVLVNGGKLEQNHTPVRNSSAKTEDLQRFEELTENLRKQMELTKKSIGTCSICNQEVLSEAEVTYALGQVYHQGCFVCNMCGRTLRGKKFYRASGKTYCEEDYLYSGVHETSERCAVCSHLILDMVLKALGKSYHPRCFRCEHCKTCLDGVPFALDKNGKVYCTNDFHKLNAPKCFACKQPIMPREDSNETVRVVAVNKDYHIECYACEGCGMQLTDEVEKRCYPLNDHLLCKNCHMHWVRTGGDNHLITDL